MRSQWTKNDDALFEEQWKEVLRTPGDAWAIAVIPWHHRAVAEADPGAWDRWKLRKQTPNGATIITAELENRLVSRGKNHNSLLRSKAEIKRRVREIVLRLREQVRKETFWRGLFHERGTGIPVDMEDMMR